jgi:tRNA(Ile)-lysidine synthase
VARVRRAVATAADRRMVLRPGERVLIGCSGGPDSTALLDALRHAAVPRGWTLAVAHVDHGIRPGSELDARHVAALAARFDLGFASASVRVEAGPSLQERARDARRAALRSIAVEQACEVIALGHTADDQAETVLMRALSGGDPMSLGAMRERSEDIARPLLRVWRRDTVAYCEALGLAVLTDPSNRDRRFLRARVRHDLLPALEQVFPGARRRLVTLAWRQQQLVEAAGAGEGP